jgi:hypothetical protein
MGKLSEDHQKVQADHQPCPSHIYKGELRENTSATRPHIGRGSIVGNDLRGFLSQETGGQVHK